MEIPYFVATFLGNCSLDKAICSYCTLFFKDDLGVFDVENALEILVIQRVSRGRRPR